MTKLAIAIAVAIATFSCAKRDEFQAKTGTEPSQTQEGKGSGIIELSASLDKSFALDTKDQESLRSLSIYQKDANKDGRVSPNEPFTFDIEIEKYKDKKMHLFLKQKGSSDITTVFADVKITKDERTGRYSMRIFAQNVQARGGDFSRGEWYISGFWGGGEQDTNAHNNQKRLIHKVKEVMPASPKTVGEKVDMDIPLGFPWTKVEGEKIGSSYSIKNIGLAIQPMGVLLSLHLENRTQYPADIVALDKEMYGFAFGGYFDFTNINDSDLDQGRFPAFKPSVIDNIDNETVNILPKRLTINSDQKASMPIYMWVMPTERASRGEHALSFTFVSAKRTTMDHDLNSRDRFDTNGVGEFTDRYTIDLSFRKTPENSQFYIRNVKIKSGLMITEYFLNRHRVDLSHPYHNEVREPNFLGYIELYNPNLDPILLENYALARISNLRRTLWSDWHHSNYPGGNNCFFHPFAMERYNEWKRNHFYPEKPEGTADRDADSKTQSHRALLISLQLKNNQKSSFQPNSLGFRSHLETGHGIQEWLQEDWDNDNRIERVRFIKGQDAQLGGKAALDGGKTMIILGNAFLEKGNPSEIPTYYYQKGGIEGVFKPDYVMSSYDWQKIVDNNECQIIVALDNYSDRHAYPIFPEAGVTNLNWSDALLLVQKHAKHSGRRRVIDATSANPFGRVNNWTKFVSRVTLVSEDEVGHAHFRVRTVAQRMPEFLNFSEKQWHAERFTGHIPEKASPGSRSAANRR